MKSGTRMIKDCESGAQVLRAAERLLLFVYRSPSSTLTAMTLGRRP